MSAETEQPAQTVEAAAPASLLRFSLFARWISSPRAFAWVVLLLGVLSTAGVGLGLGGVVKDPSVDAFVPLDHPAALARDRSKALFGVEDPVIIGLSAPDGGSVFTPALLSILRDLHEAIRLLPEVKKNDMLSLANRNWVGGEAGDLLVEPILPEQGDIGAAEAALAWQRARQMPMLNGVLMAPEGNMLTLVVPVEDPNHAGEVVGRIRATAQAVVGSQAIVHVAGVAAMNARLGEMVDGDTRIFIPLAVLVVFGIVMLALRSGLAILGPMFVVAASAVVGIGLMVWLDSRYYLITTALPVIIMAVAVADSLHFTGYYLTARREKPGLDAAAAVRIAFDRTWLPITLTTATTAAGFMGLSFGAAMAPISEFGRYAAAGAIAAWLFSLTVLPAILVLTNLQPRAARSHATQRHALVDRSIARLAAWALRRPLTIFALLLAALALFAVAASSARFDYERKRYFPEQDAVRVADTAINTALGGINFLDVLIEAPEPGGLAQPQALAAMAALRHKIETLPRVARTSGIDDYIAHMHNALTDAPYGTLPSAARAPAQYLFLFESSAPPDEFKSQFDYEQQHALLRAPLDTDRFSTTLPVVAALDNMLAQWSAQTGLQASISGRVAVNDGWMSLLAANHFVGLGYAALLVLVASIIGFRAISPAVVVLIPVAVGVLFVYAVMGALRIDIAPATSMTAAIATGLGVDFGTHLIAHVRRARREGQSLSEALSGDYSVVGRACFYSALALACALCVICVSSAPPLRWFGALIAAGATGSLLGALVVIPAVLSLRERVWGGARA